MNSGFANIFFLHLLFCVYLTSGLQCYDCNAARSEEECLTVKTCGIDQNVCYTEVRNDSLGIAQIMKSCYQAHACNINRDQNDHSCPRSCALCCYGDLCNQKGPELCTCDILKLTTAPPPRTTTRFGYFPWLPLAPRPTKRVVKPTTRDMQKRAELGSDVNQTLADNTTQATQETATTLASTTTNTTSTIPTTATTTTTVTVATLTTTNSTTRPECEEFKAIPEYSPAIICNDEGEDEELVECEGQPQTRALWESRTYFIANLSGRAWVHCRDSPEDAIGSVEVSNDRSLRLTCAETQSPNPQRHKFNRTDDNNATLDGTVTTYCTSGSYSISMEDSVKCDNTFMVTCFMVFTSHNVPTTEQYEYFETTHAGTPAQVINETTTSLATSEDAVANEGDVATASGTLETWSIIVIALACLLLVALSAVLLFRLVTRRGIYHVNKVAPTDDAKKEPTEENGKDQELPG